MTGLYPLTQNNISPITSKNLSLGLKQINGFDMPFQFKDSDGKNWKLVKSAKDASVEIPDPQFVQVTDFWVHEFPGSDNKVFIYVVEGIKRPRIDTETPVMVLYQWFSTNNNRSFTPQMISQTEWYCANVYTAPMSDSRVSKLKALCKVQDVVTVQNDHQKEPDIDISLIRGIRNGDTKAD